MCWRPTSAAAWREPFGIAADEDDVGPFGPGAARGLQPDARAAADQDDGLPGELVGHDPPRDLGAQCLHGRVVDPREAGEGLDRVAEHHERDVRADGQRRLLQPLARLRPDRVGAGQPLAVAEQGQEPGGLGVGVRVGGGLGHVRQRRGGAVPVLGHADRRGLRIRVGHPRDGLVVGRTPVARDVLGHHVAFVLAHVGERPDAGDVADRPQPLARAQVLVDPEAAGIGLDADRLQADPVHTRPSAGRHEEPVAAQLVTPVEGEDELCAVAAGGDGVPPEHQLDAVAAQGFPERVTERFGLARQHPLGRLDDHGLAAEAAHDLGQLDARRPAAQHQQPPRHLLHARRLAGAPHAVELTQAGHRRHDRVRAGRHDDVVRGVLHAADLDGAGARQLALAAQQRDAVVGQPALLTGVGVVRHHVVPPRERGRDVDLGARRRLARAVHRLARAQQRLGRDARPVRAFAADQLPLDDGHPQPARGDRGGAVLAGRPAAQDDHVVVAHVGSSVPACSATM